MKTTTVTQKCKKCDGELIYDSANKALVCQKCGDRTAVYNHVTNLESSFQDLLLRAPMWQKEASVYCCEQCGAKSVITKHDFNVVCDYCGAKSVSRTNEIPGLRPDTVALFNLTPDDAQLKVKEWLSNRYFVPSDFIHTLKKRKLSGVYIPAFTFDARVSTKYSAIGVVTKTLSTTVNGKQTSQSHVIQRPVSGVDERMFDDLVVLANQDIAPDVLKKLEPFDTQHGQVFKQEYVTGYKVSQSSREPMECWQQAKDTISGIVRDKIIAKYSGIRLHDLKLEVNITDIFYKYILLPVYVGNTEYKGKRYELLVNGQNGKVYGKAPKSRWKIFRFFALGLLAIGGAILLATLL